MFDLSYLHEQIYFQDLCGSEPELKLPSSGESPIIDPHLSPDGNLIAFVRDDELHVFDLCDGETRQLTYGAKGNGKVGHPLNSQDLVPFSLIAVTYLTFLSISDRSDLFYLFRLTALLSTLRR